MIKFSVGETPEELLRVASDGTIRTAGGVFAKRNVMKEPLPWR